MDSHSFGKFLKCCCSFVSVIDDYLRPTYIMFVKLLLHTIQYIRCISSNIFICCNEYHKQHMHETFNLSKWKLFETWVKKLFGRYYCLVIPKKREKKWESTVKYDLEIFVIQWGSWHSFNLSDVVLLIQVCCIHEIVSKTFCFNTRYGFIV